jgi:hypothetical protein
MCKVIILNGCEPESEISKKLEIFKKNYEGEIKEIFLYQLNIKPVEQRDGMDVLYAELEDTHAILVACETEISKTMEATISRLKSHYVNGELENKIFGAILIGEDLIEKELVSTAFEMGMITSANCFSTISDTSAFETAELEIKNVADSIYHLSSMVSDSTETNHGLEQAGLTDEIGDNIQEEDPMETGLGDSEQETFDTDENTEEEEIEDGENEDEDESEENGENTEEKDEFKFESYKIKLKSFEQFNKKK